MNLFTEPTICRCTPDEWAKLTLPITREDGGHQSLLLRVLELADDITRTVAVEDDDLVMAYRYAYAYGSGGYQSRFKALLTAAFRAGWVPPA